MNENEIRTLLDAILEEYTNQLSGDQYAQKCLKLIADGKATHEDAYDYALSVAASLSKSLDENLNEELFTSGQLDYETIKELLLPSYKKAHDSVNEYCIEVQRGLNEKAGIGLKPADISFRSRRVVGLAIRASKEEFYADVRRDIMGPYLENFCQNTVDESIKTNVELHGKAGLRPKVVRLATGRCCKWCLALEGKYEYPNVPKDVYRRHRNCRCTVAYDPGDGSKKNVWTKTWFSSGVTEEIQHRLDEIDQKERTTEFLSRYMKKATPGKGTIKMDSEYKKSEDRDANNYGYILHKIFGGDLTFQNRSNDTRRSDYLWNGKLWEHKHVSSMTSADNQTHSSLGQIKDNPGGLVIQLSGKGENLDLVELEKVIRHRLDRSATNRGIKEMDVIVFKGSKIVLGFSWAK